MTKTVVSIALNDKTRVVLSDGTVVNATIALSWPLTIPPVFKLEIEYA